MGLHSGRIQTMPSCHRECAGTCAGHWYQPTHGKLTCPGRLLMAMLCLGVFKEKHWSETLYLQLGSNACPPGQPLC